MKNSVLPFLLKNSNLISFGVYSLVFSIFEISENNFYIKGMKRNIEFKISSLAKQVKYYYEYVYDNLKMRAKLN